MDITLDLQTVARFLRFVGSQYRLNGYDLFEWVGGFLILSLSYYLIKAIIYYLGKSFGFTWFVDKSSEDE